jgi:large subunit ribosomal protein L23
VKIIPVFTEKSTKMAKDKKYTFLVPVTLTKTDIKKVINEIFEVNVRTIKTITNKKMTKRNMRGKLVTIPATKKAIVSLRKDEKIDLFEEEKKPKTKKKTTKK